jgi:HSP20 family molecular chaperone IbpA
MGFFDENDPFEEIMNEFFGKRARTSSSGNVVRNESEERVIDYIEENGNVYFVFEIPGHKKEDVEIKVKGNELIVSAFRKDLGEVKNYLRNKLLQEITFNKTIPVKVKKDFKFSFNNGVLEVKFNRK